VRRSFTPNPFRGPTAHVPLLKMDARHHRVQTTTTRPKNPPQNSTNSHHPPLVLSKVYPDSYIGAEGAASPNAALLSEIVGQALRLPPSPL
jgi:hypothetical protein